MKGQLTRKELQGQREGIQADLELARQKRQEYWDALSDVETALGFVELEEKELDERG